MNRREFMGLSFGAVAAMSVRDWTPEAGADEYLVATHLLNAPGELGEAVLYQGERPILRVTNQEVGLAFMPVKLNGEKLRVVTEGRAAVLCQIVRDQGRGLKTIGDVIAVMDGRGVKRIWILGGP